jgi:hypothetical protein
MTFMHFMQSLNSQPVAADDNSSFRDSEESKFYLPSADKSCTCCSLVSLRIYGHCTPLDTNETWRKRRETRPVGLHAIDDEGGSIQPSGAGAGRPTIFRLATLTDRFIRLTRWTPHATEGTALTHIHYDSLSFRGIKICVL